VHFQQRTCLGRATAPWQRKKKSPDGPAAWPPELFDREQPGSPDTGSRSRHTPAAPPGFHGHVRELLFGSAAAGMPQSQLGRTCVGASLHPACQSVPTSKSLRKLSRSAGKVEVVIKCRRWQCVILTRCGEGRGLRFQIMQIQKISSQG